MIGPAPPHGVSGRTAHWSDLATGNGVESLYVFLSRPIVAVRAAYALCGSGKNRRLQPAA